MFIKTILVKNYRLFPAGKYFEIPEINVPDGVNKGSGLTVFVGENGTGKTTLLDALALPLLSYKSENFSVSDFNSPAEGTEVAVYSSKDFEFDGTMPKAKYKGKGFCFEANVRSRSNRSYLSSLIVSDQKFIRADGETKPEDGSPDLRVSVNNPYKGSRFSENDYLYLDRNRLFHIRSGTYNPTRFDKLMEDLDFQYIDSIRKQPEDLSSQVFDKLKDHFQHQFLINSIAKFKEISGYEVTLDLIHNWTPFSKNAFFASRAESDLQVGIASLGSGYEMFFSLVYSFYLARQSGKQLIALVDEPELHLHPRLQEKLLDFLLEASKEAQIILATQSPLLVKQVLGNKRVKTCVLRKQGGSGVGVVNVEERVLPYVSADEVNYISFGLATIEYHNELYGHLHFMYGVGKGVKDFDNEFFVDKYNDPKDCPWKRAQNEVSLHTFIRNQIHHPEDNNKIDISNLEKSIKRMREIFISEKNAKS